MTELSRTHLDQLENQSIFIFREAYHAFKNIAMPWSMGKDSNVLIWLARKSFFGKVPFPVLHIDTTYEFPEMLKFREWATKHYNLKLIVKTNTEARERGIGYETHDPVTVTHELKTVALQQVLAEYKWDALITGIRRDEDPTRAKERYFSARNAQFEWDYKDQPPEFWEQFVTSAAKGEHVRVQPLLDWTEVDIWRYIQRENIPIPKMYFSRDGKRFRSLGCSPITHLIEKANAQRSTSNAQRPTPDIEPKLSVVFVGHVDHGKSTLIGRILHDTGSLPEGKIEEIKKACAAEGMEFEFAFLLDALLEEQKQNVTIDTTEIPFRTARRRYAIIDAPGHKEFLKNMITGASRAGAANLVIGADEGVREQSRRHAYLLSMLGIKQVIVVVNKMDLVGYSENRFREIEKEYRKFLQELGLNAHTFIPASAKESENVARASMKMKWYCAANVLGALDLLEPQKREVDLPLRFCVQDVYRFDGRRIIAGRIETGTLRVGDELIFSPANKSSVVATIERWHPIIPSEVEESRSGTFKVTQRDPSTSLRMTDEEAIAGDSVGITLAEQIFVERGYVASHQNETPIETNRFHADL